jgi:hypothetical protein
MNKKLLVAALFSAAATGAMAQSQSIPRNYVGIDGGYAFVDIKAEQTAQTLANLSGRTTTVVYDKAAIFGRLFGGINVHKNIDIEIGYFTTGNLKANYTNSLGTADESYSASGFDISAVLRPEPTGIYLKLGAHNTKVTGQANVTIGSSSASANASQTGSGLFGAVGYDFKFANDLVGGFGFSYYNKIGGMSDVNATILSVGISKRF